MAKIKRWTIQQIRQSYPNRTPYPENNLHPDLELRVYVVSVRQVYYNPMTHECIHYAWVVGQGWRESGRYIAESCESGNFSPSAIISKASRSELKALIIDILMVGDGWVVASEVHERLRNQTTIKFSEELVRSILLSFEDSGLVQVIREEGKKRKANYFKAVCSCPSPGNLTQCEQCPIAQTYYPPVTQCELELLSELTA